MASFEGFIVFSLLLLTFAVFKISVAVYRLYYSPLSAIPGPKLAALSVWYQTYYDVFLGGQMTLHIQDLHVKYGPIVRVGPHEVHISDPEFYETIYSLKPFSKYLPHQVWVDAPSSGFATVSHRLHRVRRAALNPFFSKQVIANFVPEIQARVSALCHRLNTEFKGQPRPVRMDRAIGCLASDLIIHYSFARCYDFTSSKDFNPDFMQALRGLVAGVHNFIHFPWLLTITKAFPEKFVEWLDPPLASVFAFRKDVKLQAKAMMEANNNEDLKDGLRPSVFRDLVRGDLPPEEKTLERLRHEGQTLVAAGGETIKTATYVAICHLLLNPIMLTTLKEELLTAWPNLDGPQPSLPTLEKLPYLTAVLQEALRLSYGVAMRSNRSSDSPLQYKDYTLPPGTLFSMSCYSMHHNESIFPDSHTFNPARWLPSPVDGRLPTAPNGKLLTRYLVSFSKGTRICIGMNLAYAELYIILANLFRRVEMELFETDEEDVIMVREQFVPWAKASSQGVRVLVK